MKVTTAATFLFVFCLTMSTHAGPDWVEGRTGDAGSLPGESQPTIGEGPLSTIKGGLAGTSLAAGGTADDFEDMFLIFINEPGMFSASTSTQFGGDAEFRARLFLFDEDGNGLLGNEFGPPIAVGGPPPGIASADGEIGGACCFSDRSCEDVSSQVECAMLGGAYKGDFTTCARTQCGSLAACCFGDFSCQVLTQLECEAEGGLYQQANLKCAGVECPTDLPDGTLIGPMATDATGLVVTEPGLYNLAISVARRDPASTEGQIFAFVNLLEISGPDGVGGGEVITAWADKSLSMNPGTYEIALRGVTFAVANPPSAAGAGPAPSGGLDLGLFGGILEAWGACEECPEDVNGDGAVDAGDLLEVLSA